jgi:hypothetical protein
MNDSLNPSCAEFQQGRLLQYAYGELLPREMEIIRRHLAGCPDCRAAAEAVAAVRAAAGEPILRENPPAAFDVKLRAAAREGPGKGPGLAERIFGWLRQPQLVYAAAGAAALLVIAGLAWHFWSSFRTKPQDLDPASLVALAEEVDGWHPPVLEAAAPDRTPVEELEQQLGELSPTSQVDFEAWYRELNQGGWGEIERGFRELDSGVRHL